MISPLAYQPLPRALLPSSDQAWLPYTLSQIQTSLREGPPSLRAPQKQSGPSVFTQAETRSCSVGMSECGRYLNAAGIWLEAAGGVLSGDPALNGTAVDADIFLP